MNALTISEQSTQLPALPPKVETKLAVIRNRSDRLPSGKLLIPSSAALNEAQRAYLQDRVGSIQKLLSPASPHALGPALARLFASLRSRRESDTEAELTVETFREALTYPRATISAWGLGEAVSQFLTGKAGDGQWLPTPAQLRKQVEMVEYPLRREMAEIREALEAEVDKPLPSADERKRLADAIRSQWGIGETRE